MMVRDLSVHRMSDMKKDERDRKKVDRKYQIKVSLLLSRIIVSQHVPRRNRREEIDDSTIKRLQMKQPSKCVAPLFPSPTFRLNAQKEREKLRDSPNNTLSTS